VYAIVVASHSGFALNLLRSLTGVVSDAFVIGVISPLWRIAHPGRFLPIDIDESDANVELLVQAINRIAADHPDCVAIPADTIAGGMLIAAAPSLRCALFPSPSRPLLDAFEEKWLFYELCRRHGISTPRSLLIGKKDERPFRDLSQVLEPPLVVKPTNRMGGEGVVVVADPDEYASKILLNPAYPFAPLMAQEFIPGRDIDISILAAGGKVLCSAVQTKVGKVIRFLENRRLLAMIETLVKETEFSGVCHFDAREHEKDGSLWIVDANPRFWGSLDAARWCGLNFTAAGLATALKQQVCEPAILIEGHYPGLPAAILRMVSGRLDDAERGRHQRAFLRNILADPSEYVIGLGDGIKALWSKLRRIVDGRITRTRP